MTDGKPVFLDTNVLVYATAKEAPLHELAAASIKACETEGSRLWISVQVLREYLMQMSRPQTFHTQVPVSELLEAARSFREQFYVAQDTLAVADRLMSLMETTEFGGKQVHDANIVATMLVHDVPLLLTNNVSDFKRFADSVTVLPLEDFRVSATTETPADE